MRSYLFLSFHRPSLGLERELWQTGLARLLQERDGVPIIMTNNESLLKLARNCGLPTRQVSWQVKLSSKWYMPFGGLLASLSWPRWWWWMLAFRWGKLTSETGHFRSHGQERSVIVCWSQTDQLLATLPARIFGISVLWALNDRVVVSWWNPSSWWLWLMARLASPFTPTRALAHETFGQLKRPTAVITPLIDPEGVRLQPWRFRETVKEWTLAVVNDLNRPWQTSLVLQALPELLELIPTVRVVIIGSGYERQQLQWLAKTLGVEKRV